MENHRIKSILESLLLVSMDPVTVAQLRDAFKTSTVEGSAIEEEQIASILQALKHEYLEMERGIQLVEIAGGYQLTSRPENGPWVRQLHIVKKASKLSKPALEALALVAYRQPVTTPEIEAVRGVDCSGVLKTLLERRLVKIVGKKDAIGKPVLYGTTQEFLEYFGLRDLSELPPLKEMQELSQELSDKLDEMAPAVTVNGE